MNESHEGYMKRRIKELREEQGIKSVPSNKDLADTIEEIKNSIRRLEAKIDQHLGRGFE